VVKEALGVPTNTDKASKPHLSTPPKRPDLNGASAALRHLISDWSSGELTQNEARAMARRMVDVALGRSTEKVPSRYAAKALASDDVVALAALANSSADSAARQVEPQFGSGPTCAGAGCVVWSSHFEMFYWPERLDETAVADLDLNGIPDNVERTLALLEDAYSFYANDLGMTAPSGIITFSWDDPYYTLPPIPMDVPRQCAEQPERMGEHQAHQLVDGSHR